MTLLSEHAGTLLLGTTAVLLLACVAIASSRVPVHQKRIGELAVWGVLAFLVLSVVPLPRVLMSEASRRPADALGSHDLVTVAWPPPTIASQELPAQTADLEAPTTALDSTPPEGVTTTVPGATTVSKPEVGGPPLSPAVAASVGPGSSVLDGLLAIYLVGAATCLLWLLTGALYLLLLLGRGSPAPQWVRDLLPSGQGAKVVVTPYRCRPFCIGWFRGKIVLPADLVRRERQEQIRLILRHEVGHLQHANLGGQLPLALLLPILFFNPLFWWLRARVRLASELLADDWAATDSRTAYARELISLAEEDARRSPAPLGAACILRSPSEFYRRIKMLLEREGNLSLRCSRGRNVVQTSVAVVVVTLLSSMGGVTAQDRTAETIEAIRKQLQALQDENDSLRQQLEKAKGAAEIQYLRDFIADPETSALDPDRFKFGMEFLFPERETADPELPKGLPGVPELSDLFQDPESGAKNPVLGVVGGVTIEEPPLGIAGRATATEIMSRSLAGPGITGKTLPGAGGLPRAGYRASPGNILDSATLQLMNQAIDLEIDIENGEAELAHLESMAKSDFVPRSELTQTKNSLRGTMRKYELIRRTIMAEVQVTEQEIELLTSRRNQFSKDSTPYREMQGQIQRLAHRLEILTSVL